MNTSVGKNAFFRHVTKRNKKTSVKGKPETYYLAGVDEFTPSAVPDENGKWTAWLPEGATMGPFDTAEAALAEAEKRLVLDGWTTDRGRAERRSQKELELRISGRLSFKKGKEGDFFAAKKEIMDVE